MKLFSFTLLELLIVIGILAILTTAATIVLNPAELLRQARDSSRLADLNAINSALRIIETENSSIFFGNPNTVYLSLPDTDNANPPECNEYFLPNLPNGWSYSCSLSDNYRKVDGNGWIPINLNSVSTGSYLLSVLPIDPINSVQNELYYTYVPGGSWNLTSLLESDSKPIVSKAVQDGGAMPGVYELGPNLKLGPFIRDKGLVGFWRFEAAAGTSIYDSSRNNNHGTILGATLVAGGKVGNAMQSLNTSQFMAVSDSQSLKPPINITVMSWVKINGGDQTAYPPFIWKNRAGGSSYTLDLDSLERFRARIDTDTTSNATVGYVTVANDNTWHLVAVSRDNSTMRFYVDGEQQSSINLSGNILYDSTPLYFRAPYNINMVDTLFRRNKNL